ncbi:MAG TPA: phosphoribosylformylglycinamidine synthase subunit PurS [Leptospiraceae bacterium]|nr:phosphoribosylformylglycinamidine synthase subunit PurS [Leptospiraceae bacterium]HMW07490.1 phosphoribosylformylglycinamidine synthase subunit PurS [Leptospiraceae bacterium]HMX33104.1 phosphoribosylformylglycinamidine synthase subunit PurS [Leptospiraceae bacterium]HMY33116.1 phosphoribosylformylglycinamidine synthase subunit PurS [Leptospiraceae bacterium]HMZ64241.1 phosphoribosylformylglycinamidine synthase subunit PurS [Leptospiraceae bacterium]
MFIGKVNITLKESVLDPQGTTVKKVLHDMGEEMVSDLRIGKYIEIKLNSKNIETAREDADRLCKKLLVNSVIETYKLEVIPE